MTQQSDSTGQPSDSGGDSSKRQPGRSETTRVLPFQNKTIASSADGAVKAYASASPAEEPEQERQEKLLVQQEHGFTSSVGNGNGSGSVYHHALQAVIYAMVFNLLIATCKLGIALFGPQRSAALFAEGLHSLADSFNSMTLLFGLKQGNRPPDRTHPFGYGLETNFWALFASVVMFGSAVASLAMGYQHLTHPPEPGSVFWAILILIISVLFEMTAVFKASQAVVQEVTGDTGYGLRVIPMSFSMIKQVQSPTTRFVFYEDIIALGGALLALTALSLGELLVEWGTLSHEHAHWPDAIASMLIGVLLLILSIRLFTDNRTVLTGASAPIRTEETIRELVLDTHGIFAILSLRTIDQGASGLFIHLKVEVNPDVPIRDMDDIIEHLKERLMQHIPSIREVFVEVVADESEEEWTQKFNKLVDRGHNDGLLKEREVEILKRFFDFTQTEAVDVMIPRPDVVSVELRTPLMEVARVCLKERRSKLPVYLDRVDNLVGVIHERDIFGYIMEGKEDSPLSDLLHSIDIYPETKPVSDLLEDFKRKRIQMAAIADEHGAFEGLVTLADIMEELVGELWDDDPKEDVELPELVVVSETELRVSGKYDIWDLNEQFGLTIPDDDYKTVGGFVFGQLGREPNYDDEVRFEDILFKVIETDGARVVTVALITEQGFTPKNGSNGNAQDESTSPSDE